MKMVVKKDDFKPILKTTDFWMGVMNIAFVIVMSLLAYIFHQQDMYYKEEMKNIKININTLTVRQHSVIDVLQELHPEKDVNNKIKDRIWKYMEIGDFTVMSAKKNE